MISRVSFALNYETLVNNMLKKQEDVRKLQEAISKGKALLKPSDDPSAWLQSMNFKEAQKEIEQWNKNLQFAMNWSKTTEGALSHLNDLLTRVREISIKAIKVNSLESRQAYLHELEQIKDEIEQLRVFEYRDRRLFPSSSDQAVEIRIGKNKVLTVSVSEDDVFSNGTDTISDHIQELYDAINSNNTNGISNAMGEIESDQQRVLSVLTEVGAIMNRLDARENILSSVSIEYEDRIANLEKTDVAKLATDYQLKKTALQAIYQTTSTVSDLTLLRYI